MSHEGTAHEKAIAVPFSIDEFGRVRPASTQSSIWEDRVLSVIGTSVRERVMRPTIGTVIPFSLFETDDDASSEIKAEITKAFVRQLPLLTLISSSLSLDTVSNTLSVTITYALPNEEVTSTTIGVIVIDGTNPLYEELA